MEVAYPPGLPVNADLDHHVAAMAADEMDIDIDSDLDPIEEGETLQSVSGLSDTRMECRVSLKILTGT